MSQSGGNFLDALLLGIKTVQNNGTVMPTEKAINFIGATVTDDPNNGRTNVAVSANPNAVSGTGFWHATSGTLDSVAHLVNLSTDTTGILPLTDLAQSGAHTNDLMTWTGTQWAPVSTIGVAVTMTGEVTGTTAASVVSGPFSTASLAWTSAITTAVLGTNRSGATLALKADAGATIATLASGSVSFANGTYLSFPDGSGHVASTGTMIRAQNGASIVARNSVNTLDANMISFDSSNNLNIGQTAATGVGVVSIQGNSCTIYFGSGASFFDCGPLNFRGSAHSGAVVLDVDTAPHAPTFISGASTTSFTIGTNAASASLVLQADAATTIQTLASTGTELANMSTPAAGTGPRLLGSSGRFEVVDSDGTVRIF